MQRIVAVVILGTALLGAPGSSAVAQDLRETTRRQESMLLLQEDLARVKGRLESLDLEYQRLVRTVDALQAAARAAPEAADPREARIGDLERRLNALEAGRAKDRQAIVDQISAKMADLIAGAGGGRPSGGAKARAGNGAVGFEHTVREGETLGTIAAAYKVKLEAVAEANTLKSPYVLRPGQVLFIPRP